MAHPFDTNYIIEVLADSWARPASFGNQTHEDQSVTYRIVDNKTADSAGDHGYVTAHSYPAWVTNVCPNAPDCTWVEAQALIDTEGASGSAWVDTLIL